MRPRCWRCGFSLIGCFNCKLFLAKDLKTTASHIQPSFAPPRDVLRMPRIGTVATMPSRQKTFQKVLPLMAPQVDHIFVFLDGFDVIPSHLVAMPNVTIIRSQDAGEYHAAGRFLCLRLLKEPSVVVPFDDDIRYPRNYVARLVKALAAVNGDAVVGFHGTTFKPPYKNYVRDSHRYYYLHGQLTTKQVDQLGAATVAFCSDRLNFDVRNWKTFRSNDVLLAQEAKNKHLPMFCIPRPWFWMRPYLEPQKYSIWAEAKRDPTEKSALMRELIAERVAAYEASDIDFK